MINLRIRTEYSLGIAYGKIPQVLSAIGDATSVAITDRSSTWGHIQFSKACKKAGKKPIFGVELAVVKEIVRDRVPIKWTTILAKNNDGLKEIYALLSEASKDENFYYVPRLSAGRISEISKNLILLDNQEVALSDNFYPRPEHRDAYELASGRNRDSRTFPMHILNEEEFRYYKNLDLKPVDVDSLILQTHIIADQCNASLPYAEMVEFPEPANLREMCEASPRSTLLQSPMYRERLERELSVIAEKKFEHYFYVIADLVNYAKQHMLVGPARGSSCGSLVCYLIGITDVDPIPFDLVFERFIDINRKDLPDIDIDFQDSKRDMVFDYVIQKYGRENVARLGTILRYKAKSAIEATGIATKIPKWETEILKDNMIERPDGDERSAFCIEDTLNTVEVGQRLVEKYPHIRLAGTLEEHAKTSGQHAAGILITKRPVMEYGSVSEHHGGVIQVDKYDAETINLLKIDCLGLRTLTVIDDCLQQVGLNRQWLLQQPLTVEDAFDVIRNRLYSGVFQFEGYAVQGLAQQMKIENFEDIVSLGALARPGPLASGGAHDFVQRRNSNTFESLHPLTDDALRVTYGVIVYQEQVMRIGREMGLLSWEDVSNLRKAMSKSMGPEYLDQWWVKFKEGAMKQGALEPEARLVWDHMREMASYLFNRSHAVAYAMVTYWCMLLKARYPLEFAVACLRHASSSEQTIKFLRELDSEGYKYVDFDPELSEKNWSVKNGVLVGGLLNINKVGSKKADEILARRASGKALTPGLAKLLATADTPYHYSKVFECRTRFESVLKFPLYFNIKSKIWNLSDITVDMSDEFVFFGKLISRTIRDLNEPALLERRGGRREEGQTKFLNMTVADDTSEFYLSIGTRSYNELAVPILKDSKIGDWFLWKAILKNGYRKMYVVRYWTEQELWSYGKLTRNLSATGSTII